MWQKCEAWVERNEFMRRVGRGAQGAAISWCVAMAKWKIIMLPH